MRKRKNPNDIYIENFDDSIHYFKEILIDHKTSHHWPEVIIIKMLRAYKREIKFLEENNLLTDFCNACDELNTGILAQKSFWIVYTEAYWEKRKISFNSFMKIIDSMSSALYMDDSGTEIFPEIQTPAVKIMDIFDNFPKDLDRDGFQDDILLSLGRIVYKCSIDYVENYL